MIRTERQYQESKKKLSSLKVSIGKPFKAGLPEKIAKAARGQSSELMNELESEIKEFEQLTHGKLKDIPLNSIEDFKKAPIRYRLSHGMTIEEFARHIQVNVRQVMRYETDEYASISLERLSEILKHLDDVELEGRLKLKKARSA